MKLLSKLIQLIKKQFTYSDKQLIEMINRKENGK